MCRIVASFAAGNAFICESARCSSVRKLHNDLPSLDTFTLLVLAELNRLLHLLQLSGLGEEAAAPAATQRTDAPLQLSGLGEEAVVPRVFHRRLPLPSDTVEHQTGVVTVASASISGAASQSVVVVLANRRSPQLEPHRRLLPATPPPSVTSDSLHTEDLEEQPLIPATSS